MIGVAQLSPFQILAEKALALFTGVTGMLTFLGMGLGMRPANMAMAEMILPCLIPFGIGGTYPPSSL